jgi:hypothetical protein
MSLEIGRGAYAVSSQAKEGFAWKVVQVEAGKAKTDTLFLAPRDGTLPSERFKLLYPRAEKE